MAKALIVYATRTGETERIAELIAEGLRISGIETDMVKAGDVKKAAELEPYDALLFGAPTYHGDMIQGMKTFLFLAENANLAGKVGGSFGAFGWSGEAPDRIFDTMKHIFKMNMAGQALRLKSSTLGGGVQMAQEYGKSVAAMLKK